MPSFTFTYLCNLPRFCSLSIYFCFALATAVLCFPQTQMRKRRRFDWTSYNKQQKHATRSISIRLSHKLLIIIFLLFCIRFILLLFEIVLLFHFGCYMTKIYQNCQNLICQKCQKIDLYCEKLNCTFVYLLFCYFSCCSGYILGTKTDKGKINRHDKQESLISIEKFTSLPGGT